jgi:hypothetical protein
MFMGSLQGLGYELEYREYLLRFPVVSEDSLFQHVLSENGAHTTLSAFEGNFTWW